MPQPRDVRRRTRRPLALVGALHALLAAWIVCAVAARPAVAQDAPSPTTLTASFRTKAPVIDGVLDEWEPPVTIHIDEAEQMWEAAKRGGWGGRDDISARIHLAYDRSHLYVAGVLRDDSLVIQAEGQRPEQGDAIELFFDTDLDDDRDVQGPRAFDGDDVQLFLMPRNPTRPWEVKLHGSEEKFSVGTWTGLRLVYKLLPPDAYAFEAAIPLHQLPGLEPGVREIGFGICLGDIDADRVDANGRPRYAYMSWNGLNPASPQDTAKLGRLVFGDGGDPAPLEPVAVAGGVAPTLFEDALYLAGPLVLLVLLLLALRWWVARPRPSPRLRVAAQVGGFVLLAAGLAVPPIWLSVRQSRFEGDLDRVVATLADALPSMEEGTLDSYLGPQRDGALATLLAGGSVARQKYLTYRALSEYLDDGFGAGKAVFPGEFFEVMPYWVPLAPGMPEQFEFPRALSGGLMHVAVGWPEAEDEIGRAVPRLELLAQGSQAQPGEAGASVTEALSFDDAVESGAAFGREGYAVSFRTVRIPDPTTSVTLTSLSSGDLRLLGLTMAAEDGEGGRPLPLGQVAAGGVETDLRGRYPRDAGVEVRRGEAVTVEIPEVERAPHQRLWLFYRASHPGPQMPLPGKGEPVARVTVHFTDPRLEPRELLFRHQESMFFEYSKHNDLLEPPEESNVRVAFSWVDEDEERLQNFVLPVGLPEGAVVERIEFVGLVDYAVRFRSAVFGSEQRAAPLDLNQGPLVPGDGTRDRKLRDSILTSIGGARVALFRDGRFSAGARCAAAEWGGVPRDVAADLALADASTRVRRQEVVDGSLWYQSYSRLSRDGWDGAILGVAICDPDHLATHQTRHLIGWGLVLLSVPLLLVVLSEVLVVFGNLRLRLLAVLTVATLLPLAGLSVFLVQVLESNHRTALEGALRADLATALDQLNEQQARLADSGRQWLTALAEDLEGAAGVADPPTESMEQVMASRLQGWLPEAWGGGFLKLEFQVDGASAEGISSFEAIAGDRRTASSDVPLRPEPGVYLFWGRPLIGVRVEQPALGGRLALSVGRPMESGFLGSLAPAESLLLTDVKGYPLDASPSEPFARDAVLAQAQLPGAMQQRRSLVRDVTDRGPVPTAREAFGDAEALVAQEVLRDQQGTPRVLLAMIQPWRRASLDLAFGEVPVRSFFVVVGGLLLVLAVFLSAVVTTRITRPIEQLERGARQISEGDLAVRVTSEEGGQLGRLTRTFNSMAQEMQRRLQDVRLLNRSIRGMNARLDLDETVATVLEFYEQSSAADRVFVVQLDRVRGRARIHGHGAEQDAEVEMVDVAGVLGEGPSCLELADPGAEALAALAPKCRSATVLPLVVAGLVRGAVVLMFESRRPPDDGLELLTTMAAQAAVALENARLYRQAVLDPATEALREEPFRRELAELVAVAQDRGEAVVLGALRVRSGGSGDDVDEALGWLADRLRRDGGEGWILGRPGGGVLWLAAVGLTRPVVADRLDRVCREWGRSPGRSLRGLDVGVVSFPDEAQSAELLFRALDGRLAAQAPEDLAEDLAALEGHGVFARSPAMRAVYRALRRVAPSELSVLIEGETGVGKEVLTDLLHRWSGRSEGPLVKVNCAALSRSLLESELFGHEKGSFTGADARKIGRFELAAGGTLFLDEVGEISPEVQVKLLRVLQEREIERVGGGAPISVDVRIVAATHRDLRQMVAEGSFREDLYYRLQGVVLHVPPLRERVDEIPLLVEHFRRAAMAEGQTAVRGFSTAAIDELCRRRWRGNIRELRNTVIRAMVLARRDLVEPDDLNLAALSTAPAGSSWGGLRDPGAGGVPGVAAGHDAAPRAADDLAAARSGRAGDPSRAEGAELPTAEGAREASGGATAAGGHGQDRDTVDGGRSPRSTDSPRPLRHAADRDPSFVAKGPAPVDGRPRSAQVVDARHAEAESVPPERLAEALAMARREAGFTTVEYAERLGVSRRTGLRDLQLLVEHGVLERLGKRRGARYRARSG